MQQERQASGRKREAEGRSPGTLPRARDGVAVADKWIRVGRLEIREIEEET